MRKLLIVVVLAVVLIAGGLGGFAYASNSSHPMTGQKLVGTGQHSPDEFEEHNILFADDSEYIRKLLEKVLGDGGSAQA